MKRFLVAGVIPVPENLSNLAFFPHNLCTSETSVRLFRIKEISTAQADLYCIFPPKDGCGSKEEKAVATSDDCNGFF